MAPSRRKGASKAKAAAAAGAARPQWKVGDLVLARVKGFQAWPARVSEPEKWGYTADWRKVLVHFFATEQIAFCNPADVEAFTEEKKEHLLGRRYGRNSDFGRAVNLIIESYEKLKKQDEANNAKSADENTLISENNTAESLTRSLSNDDGPTTTSQSCWGKTNSSAAELDVDVRTEDDTAAVIGKDGLEDKDVGSGLMIAETGMATTFLGRGRFESIQGPKRVTQRRAPAPRRARRSSRADPNKLESFMMPSSNYSKSGGQVSASIMWDGSERRNKRIRKSPCIDRNELDSPDMISNCSIEGNNSEILTADSDTLSFNEGSTVESDCKPTKPESVVELGHQELELSQRIDFQTNTVINRKKRKPCRKRPNNDNTDFAVKLDEKTMTDADVVKTEPILHGDHETSTERYSKEDGDEHLPLVKRARVRMGRASSTGEEVDTSQDSEEKPPEGSNSLSDQVRGSSDRGEDGCTDQNSFKGDRANSSSPKEHPSAKPQLWGVKKKHQFGCSLDGEAALPPSKRLHRALEAMSANAAEDDQPFLDGPSTMKADSNEYCSSSGDFSKLVDINSSKVLVGNTQKNLSNNNSQVGASEVSSRPDLPIAGGKISSSEIAAHTAVDSLEHESCKDICENMDFSDGKHLLEPSSKDPNDTIVLVQCPKSPLSPNHCQQVACVKGSNASTILVVPSDGSSKTGSSESAKPSANHDPESSLLSSNFVSGNDNTIHLPQDVTNVHMDNTDDKCGETTIPCQLIVVEKSQDPGLSNFVNHVEEIAPTVRGSGASSSPTPIEVMDTANDDPDPSHSNSVSVDHSGEKEVSVTRSSSSLTDGLDSIALATSHTSTCNVSASDKISIRINGSSSHAVRSHSDVSQPTAKWNMKEAYVTLSSFEAILGTLTRTKESIGRATRIALDCAKYGIAAKVVEILAHNLEKESSLHRRVDLFFLVDSIAQCSKGLKGEFGGIYPSAILAVLPRLLSAAAPPGSSSQENRRQCLKVLRVWQERRILPESIIRHHIRELDSLCSSSCSRAFTRRPLRNERAFDDPIREMEGMLVDEYGSNSSFQLPGFRMPRMLRDDDDGIDSDGESFEAVTPEHDAEKPEGDGVLISAVEKHRHILEDVDGELEMEDVAPSSEVVTSTCNIECMDGLQTAHHSIGNSFAAPFHPPLPMDVPPMSPPLPTSPPPPPHQALPPPPPFPFQSERQNSLSKSLKPNIYACSQNIEDRSQTSTKQQSIAPAVNPTISEGIQYPAPGCDDFQSQVPKQIPSSANCSSFISQPASHPPVQPINNVPPADGAVNKGFRLRPPHPAPSNQFSYVQSDQRVQSCRDIPSHPHPNRFHVQNSENGNFYRERDRMKFGPTNIRERWRTPPPFAGPSYPDGSGMPYAPAPYAGQLREATLPNQRWAFPPRGMNNRELLPHKPPAGGPIPVSARGADFWRPR